MREVVIDVGGWQLWGVVGPLIGFTLAIASGWARAAHRLVRERPCRWGLHQWSGWVVTHRSVPSYTATALQSVNRRTCIRCGLAQDRLP